MNASQLEFVNLVIDHLTDRGIITVESLYTRHTQMSAPRPRQPIQPAEVDQLVDILHDVRDRAVA